MSIHNKIYRLSKRHSRKNLMSFLDRAITQYGSSENAVIINIGATGRIPRYLVKKKINFQSLDIDEKRNPDLLQDIENMDLVASNSVDVLLCMEVLEHVKNPNKGISEIHRILKKNGILIGSSPFFLGLHQVPHDYYRFTRYGIQELFKNFQMIELKERNTYMETVQVLIYRLYNELDQSNKNKYVLFFPVILLISFLLSLMNKIFPSNIITTGYTYIFKKSK